MKEKILVPLGQNDRTAEIIPYIEKVARPGMKVVFLLPYPVGGFRYSLYTDLFLLSRAKELAHCYSWEGNLQRARRKVSSASENLRPKGVEVAVDVYTGGLKKAIRSHALDGDVHLIMTRAGIRNWMARLFDGTISIVEFFKRTNVAPMRLMHPSSLR